MAFFLSRGIFVIIRSSIFVAMRFIAPKDKYFRCFVTKSTKSFKSFFFLLIESLPVRRFVRKQNDARCMVGCVKYTNISKKEKMPFGSRCATKRLHIYFFHTYRIQKMLRSFFTTASNKMSMTEEKKMRCNDVDQVLLYGTDNKKNETSFIWFAFTLLVDCALYNSIVQSVHCRV